MYKINLAKADANLILTHCHHISKNLRLLQHGIYQGLHNQSEGHIHLNVSKLKGTQKYFRAIYFSFLTGYFFHCAGAQFQTAYSIKSSKCRRYYCCLSYKRGSSLICPSLCEGVFNILYKDFSYATT